MVEYAVCEECHQTSLILHFYKVHASCARHHLAHIVFFTFFFNDFLSSNEAVQTKGRKPAEKKSKEEKIT